MFANALDNLLTFDLKLDLSKMSGVPPSIGRTRAPGSTATGLDPIGSSGSFKNIRYIYVNFYTA